MWSTERPTEPSLQWSGLPSGPLNGLRGPPSCALNGPLIGPPSGPLSGPLSGAVGTGSELNDDNVDGGERLSAPYVARL